MHTLLSDDSHPLVVQRQLGLTLCVCLQTEASAREELDTFLTGLMVDCEFLAYFRKCVIMPVLVCLLRHRAEQRPQANDDSALPPPLLQ